jgi:hypothetical protein
MDLHSMSELDGNHELINLRSVIPSASSRQLNNQNPRYGDAREFLLPANYQNTCNTSFNTAGK